MFSPKVMIQVLRIVDMISRVVPLRRCVLHFLNIIAFLSLCNFFFPNWPPLLLCSNDFNLMIFERMASHPYVRTYLHFQMLNLFTSISPYTFLNLKNLYHRYLFLLLLSTTYLFVENSLTLNLVNKAMLLFN